MIELVVLSFAVGLLLPANLLMGWGLFEAFRPLVRHSPERKVMKYLKQAGWRQFTETETQTALEKDTHRKDHGQMELDALLNLSPVTPSPRYYKFNADGECIAQEGNHWDILIAELNRQLDQTESPKTEGT